MSNGYATVTNFYYTLEQAREWVGFNEFNLLSHADDIKKIIKECVLAKKALKNL